MDNWESNDTVDNWDNSESTESNDATESWESNDTVDNRQSNDTVDNWDNWESNDTVDNRHLSNDTVDNWDNWESNDTVDNWESNDTVDNSYSNVTMDNRESNDHYEFFKQFYRCYSLSRVDKVHLECGNKIIMPQSAFDRIAYTDIEYPLQFELRNLSSVKITHCGVLEFTAEEGFIYMPNWMMETMKIQEYDTVRLKNVSLMKATHMKLQPHTQDFLELSNPKAVLETTLRNFSCITCGETIMILHDNKKFYIDILETKPSSAVCMIDTDCEVDFAPPLDYKEPEKPVKKVIKQSQAQEQKRQQVLEEEDKVKVVQPFSGKARRLDGMPSSDVLETPSDTSSVQKEKQLRAKPEPRKAAGKLVFGSNVIESRREVAEGSLEEDTKQAFQPFTGKSFSLRR